MSTWGSNNTVGLVNSRHLGVLYLALYPDLEGFHHKLATGFETVLDIKGSVGFFNILYRFPGFKVT